MHVTSYYLSDHHLQMLHIIVFEHFDDCATRACTDSDGGMVECIGDDETTLADEGWNSVWMHDMMTSHTRTLLVMSIQCIHATFITQAPALTRYPCTIGPKPHPKYHRRLLVDKSRHDTLQFLM